ncbi:hypothetical protein [Micromonospora globbae]|jgi:hypothetical protein|uniref:Uncharacterized protein n=1 Tax=Micromonospora globbae TaxID=1894969 RepID=A0A420EY83_9ACTN|nr:hypothetical protein [Micromonospora globbae]RKF25726.1 hypothetical protein D7I43_20210 [Micromonospora globbae]
MPETAGLVLPSFHLYYASPVKIVATPEGGARVWRVSMETGGWVEENDLFDEIVFAVGGDVFSRTVDQFVQDVELYRSRYLSGDGAVFALYETVRAIQAVAEDEGRVLTVEEAALVRGICRRTFVMFEEELQRAGDPGADPSLAAPDQEA